MQRYATISYTDMLAALRRELIRHEYHASRAPLSAGRPRLPVCGGASAKTADRPSQPGNRARTMSMSIRAGDWHHSRAHDFFARRRWDPDELGVRLLDFLVVTFLAADAPIRLAVPQTPVMYVIMGYYPVHRGSKSKAS